MKNHEEVNLGEFDIFAVNPIFHVQNSTDEEKKAEEVKSNNIDIMERWTQDFECWICREEFWRKSAPKEIYLNQRHLRHSVWRMSCCKKHVHGACFHKLAHSRFASKICPF